jgi:hypothetical protein
MASMQLRDAMAAQRQEGKTGQMQFTPLRILPVHESAE